MAVLLLIHAYEIFNKLMITILLFSVINLTGYDVIGPEKKRFYFWRDLNPQSPASEADALSIRPQKHQVISKPPEVICSKNILL